jgi:hypothetical protein
MDAMAPLKQLREFDDTQRGLARLPGWSPLPWPAGQEEFIKGKPQQEEVVDEIIAWWQKALGTKAVLGQASNKTSPGPRAPVPIFLWTKPESGHAPQQSKVAEATPAERKRANNPGPQERKDQPWMDRSLTALGQLKQGSGVLKNGIFPSNQAPYARCHT